jgi:haloalkane dehalogenase
MDSHKVEVLGSSMHYVEAGTGDPIVFVHGNPTSSYLWRNVIPRLSGQGRCLAVDLIGFGRSGKPDIDYRFADHARYLDAWFDALKLEKVTLVLHDWGTALGFNWACRHQQRVAGIAFMEALLNEMTWDDLPEDARALFQAFRTPGIGEKLIMEDNVFIEQVLPNMVVRELSNEEMNAYRAPFPTPKDRKPVWRWPNELPINGQPAEVVQVIRENAAYLSSSPVPKLLLTFEPGVVMHPEIVELCRKNFRNLEIRPIGKGLHFVQEDEPEAIGDAIAQWRKRVLG